MTIAPWTRRLRMGMVGGGQGAFIGSVRRIAAALDGHVDLTAGVFSRVLLDRARYNPSL